MHLSIGPPVLVLLLCRLALPLCTRQPCTDAHLERQFVRETGDSAAMRCRFAGLSEREVKSLRWYGPRDPNIPLTVGDEMFSLDERLHLARASFGQYQEWTLTIDFLQRADSGIYRCVFNTQKPGFTVQLNVTEPKLVTAQSGSAVYVSVTPLIRLGGSALLECRSNRSEGQDVDLNWDRAVRQTKQVDSIVLPDGVSELRITSWQRIDNVTLADGGAHTCVKSLIQTGRVLGRATVLLKIRMSLQERLFIEATTRLSTSTQPPSTLPGPQHSWQDPWQQQQQQQQQYQGGQKPIRHGSKAGGGLLNDAGLTSNDRSLKPPDYTYSVDESKISASSWRRRSCLQLAAAATSIAFLLLV